MNIEHVSLDIESGGYLVAITGTQSITLEPGSRLRCAAYRFVVVEVKDKFPDTTVCTALLAGPHRPTLGMCVHFANDPLTVEEVQAAIRHLLMLPRMLLGIDCETLAQELEALKSTDPVMIESVHTLWQVARAGVEATKLLPQSFKLTELERRQAEVVDLLR
jgi:hypothetical protein